MLLTAKSCHRICVVMRKSFSILCAPCSQGSSSLTLRRQLYLQNGYCTSTQGLKLIPRTHIMARCGSAGLEFQPFWGCRTKRILGANWSVSIAQLSQSKVNEKAHLSKQGWGLLASDFHTHLCTHIYVFSSPRTSQPKHAHSHMETHTHISTHVCSHAYAWWVVGWTEVQNPHPYNISTYGSESGRSRLKTSLGYTRLSQN